MDIGSVIDRMRSTFESRGRNVPGEAWIAIGLGTLVLVGMVVSTISNWKFRQRAVRVPGEVIKHHRYSKYVIYYISYEFAGAKKIAELSEAHFMPMKPGDKLDILIDPDDPPNSIIPEGLAARSSGSGNCLEADTKLFSFFHLLTLGLGAGLVMYGLHLL
jgi:hypothetical protein